MPNPDRTDIKVEAKHAGHPDPRPWAFIIRQNGKIVMTSGPVYASTEDAIQAGWERAKTFKPLKAPLGPAAWT